jgi:anti-sigma B factor antagonist
MGGTAMESNGSFRYGIENLPDDEHSNKVTMVKCHGRLIRENAGELKEIVKPLLSAGGRIVIDLSDLNYMDSSGLGTLIGLKVSAVKQGLCILEFVNMTPRVMELLRISNLSKVLSS